MPVPAATPTQELRRAGIVAAAVDCLVEWGWSGTTLNRIAEKAGVSRGLISYHFDNRDDLLAAVLEWVVSSVFGEGAARMSVEVRAQSTAVEMIRVYVIENLRFVAEHRREMAALGEIMPNLRRPDGSRRFDTADEEPIIRELAGIFELGVSAGEFVASDSMTVAYFVRRCIDGGAHRIITEPDFDLKTYGGRLVDLILHGVIA